MYPFLDPVKEGAYLAAYIIGIAVAEAIIFCIMYCVVSLRIRLTPLKTGEQFVEGNSLDAELDAMREKGLAPDSP